MLLKRRERRKEIEQLVSSERSAALTEGDSSALPGSATPVSVVMGEKRGRGKNAHFLKEYWEKVRSGDPSVKRPGRVRHGIDTFLKSGRCKDARVKAVVDDYIRQTMTDLGGDREVTVGQRAMLLHQRVSLTVILLGEEFITQSKNFSKAVMDPSAVLKIMGGYLSAFRAGQKALGLDKRARDDKPKDIASVLKQIQRDRDLAIIPEAPDSEEERKEPPIVDVDGTRP